ncbi:TonB-dependent receptor [Shewanella decolorationis]|uniref:TonB-dependent receptor n=1 Tax=Shewanella decolorationis TaxID=256839 RepID=A0A5B8QTV4_9GAMM|nr:TonB-dependent receptor [Shewanella decolorationis]QDZ90090.1 TonB-dependent receptor [Shewanella decolorationis]
MSSRYFVISLTALAVSCVYTNPLNANPLYSQTLDLIELNNLYHSSDDGMQLSYLNSLTLQRGDHSGNTANISMRSASQGVAVMQDRVYFSPAPYSAPQLQLLPNLLLQQNVTSTPLANISVGGQGAFGVVSYQSLDIEDRPQSGRFTVEGSTESDVNAGMNWGLKQKEYGVLLAANYAKEQGDANFLNGSDADRKKTDLLFKVNAASLLGARSPQQTEFTYQFIDDDSYRSQLGVTAADWQQDPLLLYSATAQDIHKGRQHKYQLSHQVDLSGSKVFSDFYYQSYSQQLNQLGLFNGQEIDAATLSSISAFDLNPIANGADLNLLVQNNDYSAFGAQTQAINQYGEHQITYSARYHTDKAEMRFGEQTALWQADRSIVSDESSAVLAYTDDATALTSAIDSLWRLLGMQIKLGLTYEHVSVNREVTQSVAGLNEADFSDSDWMPQFGVLYDAGDWRFSTDIRRAWTAASAGNSTQEAQVSLHYQVSAQYAREGIKADLRAYVQEFDNMHVDCDSYSMCADARLFTQENIPDVLTYGVELGLGYRWNFGEIELPLMLNYQYLSAEYQTSTCTEIQGCVLEGDRLAWLPEHQLQLSAGIDYGEYQLNLEANYQSERDFSQFGSELHRVSGQWRVDLAANYDFDKHHRLYIRVENLLDESLVTTASNSGIRTENGRISYLGYQWRF